MSSPPPIDRLPVTDASAADTAPGPDTERWLGNAGSLVAGRLVVAALGWAGTIIVARTLDQDQFGRFTFVFGLLGMMSIATDLGLGRIAISGVMPEADDRSSFAGTYVVLRSSLGLVGYGLAVLFTIVGGYPTEIVQATAIAGSVVIVATASHAYELVLQAHLRLQVVAVSAVIGRTAQLGFTVAVAVAGGSLLWFLVPAVLAELVIAGVKIPRSLRLQSMTYSVRPGLWRSMLVEAVPLSLGTALATLYFRVDSIMLSKLDDFVAVGIYGVAFKFIDLLHFLSLSISVPLLTVLVRSWPDRPQAFRAAVSRTVALLALLSGALIVHFGLFAAETLELLYGSAYRTGDVALQLLVVGEIIGFCSVLGLTVLTAAGRHRPYPFIALAGLAANVGLNLWAIPRWSFEGAAVTTIATELIVVVCMLWLVTRVPDVGGLGAGPPARALPPIALALVAGLIVQEFIPWPVAALAAVGVYLAGATLTGLTAAVGLSELRRTATVRQREDARVDHAGGGPADGPHGAGPPVAVLGHSRSGSGAERVLLRYVDAMAAEGWRVSAICPDGYLDRELRSRGIVPTTIAELQLPGGPRPVAAVRLAGRWIAAAIKLRRTTTPETTILVNGLLALPAAKLAGRNSTSIWLVHDVVVRPDLRVIAGFCCRGLSAAIGVSRAAATFALEKGVPTEVVRNGTIWPTDPASIDITGRPVVGINAMVTPWKGHHVLLEALADLPGMDLEILGGMFPKDGEYLQQLQDRAARPDLVGRVRFLGHVEDPLSVMRSWSVAVSASVSPEAGPLAVLEAMSVGLPVVATDHGGAVEVIGNAGVLVEPGNPRQLRDAILLLTVDARLRQRCARSGRTDVAERLNEQSSNEAFLRVMSRFASAPVGGGRG